MSLIQPPSVRRIVPYCPDTRIGFAADPDDLGMIGAERAVNPR
jgi:hypothetical protein